jgi:membrane fusion protein, heavy metal efflux system
MLQVKRFKINSMSKYRFFSRFFFVAFTIALVSCNGNKKAAEESKEAEVIPEDIVEMRSDQIKLADIQLGKIEMRSLSGTTKVNGLVSVAPQNLATVCAPMGGYVRKTSLIPGNPVHKGQVLAVIENPEFIDIQQNYLQARNKFKYAEADYKRQSELYKNDVSSQKSYQQVTTDYRNLKAEVNALKQKLSLIGINPAHLTESNIHRSAVITSPITGYVKTVNVNLGKYVTPADIMFEVVNNDKLFLELTLFDKDAAHVDKGEKIRFFINNEAEQHEAVVYQTGKSVSEDKTYKVYANVLGKCKNVLPGMYVNAVIETSGHSVASVPSDAVVSFDDKDYIFVFDKNKQEGGKPFTEYRMIEVRKGVTDSGYTEIILPEKFNISTAKVVVKGAYNLLSAKKNAGEMSC